MNSFLVFVNSDGKAQDAESAYDAEGLANLFTGIDGGQVNATFTVVDRGMPVDMAEALLALYDMGDPDSLKVLNLIDRLLADDWTGSGVYEALDQALSAAEALVPQD